MILNAKLTAVVRNTFVKYNMNERIIVIFKHCVWWSGQCVLQFDDLIFSSRRTTTVSDCIFTTMSAIRPVQFCLLEESRERRRREKRLPLFYSKTLKSIYNCPTFPFGIL